MLRLPSWELTYPLLIAFWGWFSFSPGEICYIDSSLEGKTRGPQQDTLGVYMANPLNHRTVHTNACHFFEMRLVQNWWNRPGCQAYKEQQSWSCPQENQQWVWGVSVFYQGLHCRLRGLITFVCIWICIYIVYNVYIDSVSAHKFPLRDLWSQTIPWKFQNKIQGECTLWHPDLCPDNLTIMTWGMWREQLGGDKLFPIWITIWWLLRSFISTFGTSIK